MCGQMGVWYVFVCEGVRGCSCVCVGVWVWWVCLGGVVVCIGGCLCVVFFGGVCGFGCVWVCL